MLSGEILEQRCAVGCLSTLLSGMLLGCATRTTPDTVEVWRPSGPDGGFLHWNAWMPERPESPPDAFSGLLPD